MGFISFNEKYYSARLEALENRRLTRGEIYEAQQLLKVLDDLADEGYTNLNDQMERDFSCLTRLRMLLEKNGAVPIPVGHDRLPSSSYDPEEHELEGLLEKLMHEARGTAAVSDDAFLGDMIRYCEWIGYEKGTAYVFLLRDSLLPYIYFRSRRRESVYPWLIGRRFLEDVSNTVNVDDDLRLPVYEALEEGHVRFEDFSAFCAERVGRVMDAHPYMRSVLSSLLGSLKEERIVVVESGYAGTIPMMLKTLDDRVDFRLYTTAPFLFETYKDRIFCQRYEDIRRFETVYSQDLLLRYSSFRGGRFFVDISADSAVKERSLGEIKLFLP